MTADLLWAGDSLVPDAAYLERSPPALTHPECGHRRWHGHVCRLCAEPMPTLQDEARWRDDDYARALAKQEERRRR